jgi:diaminopimelate epimerase
MTRSSTPPGTRLRFTKMHGLGNDFVVLDGIGQHVELTGAQLRLLADRRFGVGCDQVLVVERPRQPGVDFRYRIFNADGGEVEQCGNGARCFVRFVRDHGLTAKRAIRVETAGGIITPQEDDAGEVTVDMGVPRFAPADVPFVAEGDAPVQPLDVDGRHVEIIPVSMGNPHAVQVVVDVDAAPVSTQGPAIERHPRFPNRVNAGYMQVVDRATIRLRVWERGVGETLACGTGACATLVASVLGCRTERAATIELPGGDLFVRWDESGSVFMTGPATEVFTGMLPVPPDDA